MSKAKEVLLFELDEQSHPERVEDVIYWALKYYYENRKKGTWGETIAYYLVKAIEEAEGKVVYRAYNEKSPSIHTHLYCSGQCNLYDQMAHEG